MGVKDCRGVLIEPGDLVAYPGKQSERAYLQISNVVETHTGFLTTEDYITVKGIQTNDEKRARNQSIVKHLDRVVVVQKARAYNNQEQESKY
jgi:hypothetical protein